MQGTGNTADSLYYIYASGAWFGKIQEREQDTYCVTIMPGVFPGNEIGFSLSLTAVPTDDT